MKMSLAMQLLGYPVEFVQDERERESGIKDVVAAKTADGQIEVTIEPQDFDAAILVPWSTSTCLLAQCANRYGMFRDSRPDVSRISAASKEAETLMRCFDKERGVYRHDESYALRKIRESLPLTVMVPKL